MNGGYIVGGEGALFVGSAYTKWPSAVKASRRRSTTTMTRSLEDEFPPPSLGSHAFGGRRARDVSCDKDPKSARR